MKRYFQVLAEYNRWANARLYAAALKLPDDVYRKPTGVFFGSLHGTLNHLLLTDRIWLKRLTGSGEHLPDQLNSILYDDRQDLTKARVAEDARIIELVAAYDDAALARTVTYTNRSGRQFQQPIADVLMHFFNHQTHHRGHAHACLSIVTGTEPPSLDLLLMQRGTAAPDLIALLG